MNTKWVVVAGLTLAIGAGVGFGSLFTSRNFHANASTNAASGKENFYSFTARDIAHKEVSMSQYKGKVVLVVNVASEWGLTKANYNELQELYVKYKDQGLEILGFPCNQFGGQEPGTEEEIKKFAQEKFGVTFPLFEKINVNGENEHPLFGYLKGSLPGVLGTTFIKWNFSKFLIDRAGIPVARFGPKESPKSFEEEIKKLL